MRPADSNNGPARIAGDIFFSQRNAINAPEKFSIEDLAIGASRHWRVGSTNPASCPPRRRPTRCRRVGHRGEDKERRPTPPMRIRRPSSHIFREPTALRSPKKPGDGKAARPLNIDGRGSTKLGMGILGHRNRPASLVRASPSRSTFVAKSAQPTSRGLDAQGRSGSKCQHLAEKLPRSVRGVQSY